MSDQTAARTPWQRVHSKFGISSAALAREINRDRSKVSRHIQDDDGLISGRDQLALLEAAKRLGVDLRPEDMIAGA